MDKRLRILILEDNSADAELMERRLLEAQLAFEAVRVETEAEFSRAIDTFRPHVILADYTLPKFEGGAALRMAKQKCSQTPFIFVAGTIGEERAIEMLKEGATDYVLKERMSRLGAAVQRALLEADNRAEHERAVAALRESEERYRLVAETAGDAIITIDDESMILFVNLAAGHIFGHRVDEMISQPLVMLMPERFRAQHKLAHGKFVRTGVRTIDWKFSEFVGLHKDGHEFPIDVSFAEGILSGKRIFTGIVRDITERKRVERALRESEERYAIAIRGANDGLWDWDLRTNECFFSPRWAAMLGFEEAEISRSPEEWLNRVHPEDIEGVKAALFDHMQGITDHFEYEQRMIHKDREYRWMLIRGQALFDSENQAFRIAGSQSDITARKLVEGRLHRQAFYDALTGLPNRVLFSDRLNHSVYRAKRSPNQLFAVLFLDLDRFKVVNDSLGHNVGDHLLVAVARKLESCIRPGDTVARVGGDEFAILLEDVRDVLDAVRAANRVHHTLEASFRVENYEIYTTASIGITMSNRGYDNAEGLMRDADAALYRAKGMGKARYEVFDTGVRARAMSILKLETDLRHAIEHQEFELHYQPIIDLKKNRIDSFEALLRWRHPEKGLLFPESFLSTTEETGMIISIGWWVLRTACKQLRLWQDRYPDAHSLKINVNITAKQFAQPGLIEGIKEILAETRLPSKNLNLEVTESIILENEQSVHSKFAELQALDVRLHIDDFGTGYSSLSYLHRFPFDTLKIDRSFISGFESEENREIVKTILTLARTLGKDVTAEGVETNPQLARLVELDCGYAQGYVISKAMPAEGAEQFLVSNLRESAAQSQRHKEASE